MSEKCQCMFKLFKTWCATWTEPTPRRVGGVNWILVFSSPIFSCFFSYPTWPAPQTHHGGYTDLTVDTRTKGVGQSFSSFAFSVCCLFIVIGPAFFPLHKFTAGVRSRTGQPLPSDTVRSRRLSFFGHLHRADPRQDHHRALQACIMDPPGDWRQRAGRPRQSWLRTVEADLRPMNLGLATCPG